MQTNKEKEDQRIYKVLSEPATVLFDALIYGELTMDMIAAFLVIRKEAVKTMGQDWVNTVIQQSFNLIIGG